MDDARKHLTPHLLPDEQLLWTGRPDPGKHLTGFDLYLVPFSLLWGGFALTAFVDALLEGERGPEVLFLVPFALMGLYLIAGRFVIKARRKRRTAYGLTEGRALVAEGAGSLSESSAPHGQVSVRRSRGGGHVTVSFGRSHGGWAANAGQANTGMDFFARGESSVAFYDVPDVAGLERALRQVER